MQILCTLNFQTFFIKNLFVDLINTIFASFSEAKLSRKIDLMKLKRRRAVSICQLCPQKKAVCLSNDERLESFNLKSRFSHKIYIFICPTQTIWVEIFACGYHSRGHKYSLIYLRFPESLMEKVKFKFGVNSQSPQARIV